MTKYAAIFQKHKHWKYVFLVTHGPWLQRMMVMISLTLYTCDTLINWDAIFFQIMTYLIPSLQMNLIWVLITKKPGINFQGNSLKIHSFSLKECAEVIFTVFIWLTLKVLAGAVYIKGMKLVITAPADALAPNGARASAEAKLTWM